MKGLLDNGRTEEALEIAAAGELEARDQLLRHGGSTDDVTALEHGHGEAAAGQVSGGGEAVVAGSNDQRVPFVLLRSDRPSAEASPPHVASLTRWLSAVHGEESRNQLSVTEQ